MRHAKKAATNWIQSDHQAVTKGQHDGHEGQSSRAGRIACTAHVATYTATQAAVLYAGSRVLGLRLKPGRVAAALALSAGTHWWADRRMHLKADPGELHLMQGRSWTSGPELREVYRLAA
ncbi:hypothetical protein AB0D86_49570 [Streptomyces sp. NPDC048324]|uniref:hypothetical protein n=1 Tax=Streptomyces sp. NPDC048324 TaxID=3157205 RepID=UPI003412E8B4